MAACAAEEQAPVCPADEPDCDRLDEPCVLDAVPEGPSAAPQGLTPSLTTSGKYRVWPDGRVPYTIAASVGGTTESRLLQAMGQWQSKTQNLVRFEPATGGDAIHLVVEEGSPRVSFVGYRKTKIATLYLRNPEYITVIRHELGHVLGLSHEHQRQDRSGYIQYEPQNIVDTQSCKNQFAVCSDCVLVGDYHVGSVMHYRSYRDLSHCRVDNKAVLLHLDGDPIDHDWVLTSNDVSAIEQLYGAGGHGGTPGAGGGDRGGAGGSPAVPPAGGQAGEWPPAAPAPTSEPSAGCAVSTDPGGAAGGALALALALAALARRRVVAAAGRRPLC